MLAQKITDRITEDVTAGKLLLNIKYWLYIHLGLLVVLLFSILANQNEAVIKIYQMAVAMVGLNALLLFLWLNHKKEKVIQPEDLVKEYEYVGDCIVYKLDTSQWSNTEHKEPATIIQLQQISGKK